MTFYTESLRLKILVLATSHSTSCESDSLFKYVIIRSMVNIYKTKKIVWIDLDNPSSDEVRDLMKKYPIHPLVADELVYQTPRSRIDAYENIIYLILHFPNFDKNRKIFSESEIDFIIGKNFFITTHYRDFNILHEIARMFETNTLSGENKQPTDTGLLFFQVVKEIYALSINELNEIQTKILSVEEEIFSQHNNKHDLVRKISHVRRDILDFRRIIHPHQEILHTLKNHGGKLFGKDFSVYMSFLHSDYSRLFNALETNKDTIESLQATNDSLVSYRANEIMKTLTMMAFATFPLMIILNLFIVPAKSVPILGTTGDFWIILAITALSGFGIYIFFKHKRWI